MNLNIILKTTKYDISFFQKDNTNEILELFEWFKTKTNTMLFYSKCKQKQKQVSKANIKITFKGMYELTTFLNLLINRDYQHLAPSFYMIVVTKYKVYFYYVNTNIIGDIINIVSLLLNEIDDNLDIKKIDDIIIYFPFEVGNIFSKKRYPFEINLKYMESLKSYRSLDKNKNTVLQNYLLERDSQRVLQESQDIAILNEFITNKSITYKSNYVYIDFIKVLLESDDLPTNSFENLTKIEIYDILNKIDSFYVKTVLDQQESIYNVIKKQLRIDENHDFEGSKYSFQDLLNRLIKRVNKEKYIFRIEDFKNLNKYLKDINKLYKNKPEYLYKLQKLYKDDSLNEYEKVIFYLIAIYFPLYNNNDMIEKFTSYLNAFGYKDKVKVEYIADMLFGKESIFYEKDDKRKLFFKDVKNLFYIYNNSIYEHKNFKDLFNNDWIKSALRARKN